jgi:hypothetical protein
MKQLKRKLIATFIVMMFALVATVGVTYAWWNMLQQTESETVTLGQGDEIIVSETLAGTGILIPATQTPTGAEVTEVVFTYDVSANQEAVDAGVINLTVVAQDILIGGDPTHAGLVNIVITPNATTVSTTPTEVTVTITLTEPADQATYEAIKNQVITFDIVFTLA